MITKLKNRYGQADVNKGISFYGEIGMFRELPKPEDIGDYQPYLSLDNLRPKDKIDIDIQNKNVFKF
jgi:hypothetical protein